MRHYFERYCKDFENIENYQEAKAENFKGWHCHHRLETHNSDGERRLVDITQKELIALGMYYHRPASELIFLTSREHNAFKKGKKLSEETKNKISEANKGESNPMYGKHLSEEHKNKISEAMKGHRNSLGKKHSAEHNKKIGAASIGKHWYNNGKENRFCFKCPDGFIPGMLRK